MPRKVTSVKVDIDVWNELKKAAIDAKMPLEDAVDYALRSYLEKVKKQ